jgi:hypothetical protein
LLVRHAPTSKTTLIDKIAKVGGGTAPQARCRTVASFEGRAFDDQSSGR